ncbi:hypothetical protein CSKR_102127 [Clonorchis sinensis]|uniref:Uncharacterized protein n=1 Tax=Clonorchis sinensis TaxID=79923 RepID=A0A3R7H819_CLOSI|nr:hypothetical protein CSKR_102127 [Clonorchis sinensis]
MVPLGAAAAKRHTHDWPKIRAACRIRRILVANNIFKRRQNFQNVVPASNLCTIYCTYVFDLVLGVNTHCAPLAVALTGTLAWEVQTENQTEKIPLLQYPNLASRYLVECYEIYGVMGIPHWIVNSETKSCYWVWKNTTRDWVVITMTTSQEWP